jgi:hypothetical protein
VLGRGGEREPALQEACGEKEIPPKKHPYKIGGTLAKHLQTKNNHDQRENQTRIFLD